MSGMYRMGCVVTVVLLTLTTSPVSEACSCMYAHPQTHLCDADFVIKANVRSEGRAVYTKTLLENGKTRRVPFEMKYRININKVFKETTAFENVTRNFVYTPYHESMCGIRLNNQTKYLLTGSIRNKKMYVGLCSFVQEWATMPVRMRKGFNFQYEKNCACKVEVGFGHVEKLNDGDHCNLGLHDDPGNCYHQHAMCKLYQGEGNSTGSCRWTKPTVWKDCMKKAEEEAWKEP